MSTPRRLHDVMIAGASYVQVGEPYPGSTPELWPRCSPTIHPGLGMPLRYLNVRPYPRGKAIRSRRPSLPTCPKKGAPTLSITPGGQDDHLGLQMGLGMRKHMQQFSPPQFTLYPLVRTCDQPESGFLPGVGIIHPLPGLTSAYPCTGARKVFARFRWYCVRWAGQYLKWGLWGLGSSVKVSPQYLQLAVYSAISPHRSRKG